MKEYELIVIGTGPAGEKASVKAAYFGHRVAIIEKESLFGGAEVVTGTLPSKTLKETALFFSGKHEKGLFGIDRDLQRQVSIQDFMYRKNLITSSEAKEVRDNLLRHKVDIYQGIASFEDAHTLRVGPPADTLIRGEYILIATGSYPFHPSHIPFDKKRVHDSDSILQITRFPTSLCVLGAGVIGCEYATIFSTVGAKVYLVNDKKDILPHIDEEISSDLVRQMHESNIDILFNESVKHIEVPEDEGKPLKVFLASGRTLEVDMFLFAAGRSGNVSALGLEKLGITVDSRQAIKVDSAYRTTVPHIFAAGDVIGFPALASTSMEQGRLAVANMFKTKDLEQLPIVLPYGIYTIPEVSMVGITEQQAKAKQLPYMTGKARYADMPRGKIMGADDGFLKLVFETPSLIIKGVHVIGFIATELIHFAIHLIEEEKTLYYLIEHVYNYPTLHDLYKYAAYDGLSNVSGHKVKS
ncbi:MAG: Si-specific NAD(P)(+) transhydrogenase [Simkania sp.]|nr:Si-specific NAD(P)(+) transhydrogenase [Simkania sp.]